MTNAERARLLGLQIISSFELPCVREEMVKHIANELDAAIAQAQAKIDALEDENARLKALMRERVDHRNSEGDSRGPLVPGLSDEYSIPNDWFARAEKVMRREP